MEPNNLPLKDIHLPEPISWWPPAIGWWILAGVLILLMVLSYWLYTRITRRTAIKTAMKLLQKIQQDTSSSPEQILAELATLIRRVAISIFPREDVAGLTGKAWLKFLDETMGEPRFSEQAGSLLTNVRYRKENQQIDVEPLIILCEDWLKTLKKRQ